jgi:hypothetical protein
LQLILRLDKLPAAVTTVQSLRELCLGRTAHDDGMMGCGLELNLRVD